MDFKPNVFKYKDSSLTAHLRFSNISPAGNIGTERAATTVAAHTNCYSSTLPFLSALVEHLKLCIPFQFEITSEPETLTLAGPSYENMHSVQFRIAFGISSEKAKELFEQHGFYHGLEYIK